MRIIQRLLLFLTILGILFSCAHPMAKEKESDDGFNPLGSVIDIYRDDLDHLSAVRGSECPMYPSCSEYSKECIQKHGLLIGWIMTCDRLMRCGRDEMRLSPRILVNGKWKYYDPVEKNDFWWHKK